MRCLLGLAFAVLVAVPAQSQDARIGNWHYTADTDSFSDADRSFVFATNTESKVNLAIGIKCMESGPAFLLLHKYMGGDGDNDVRVLLRLDRDTPLGPSFWRLQAGHKATLAPRGEAIRVIQQMRTGSRLAVRITDPLDGETIEDTISLDGFTQAVANLPCARALGGS